MENRYKNQKDACLAYLEEHDSITPLEALHEFGCFRLAAVIARLREDGHIIRTDIAEGEKRYAIYTLMKEGVEYDG
jgi:hypothetical protein